ncbi:FKBP-type peptidyl-prolyl cis-trans isomerase [Colwellia ponticola]|uniref:Peptidyl-prolyl cis-trans isomerase n=1 Tax=Colwellia ponticola TaxID=2304625 RepID=A0A8H2PN31_9GAMM|nr:FKBP-type peptidyl-prolyl cis-trans isomerase [Colwellia ponticola]RGP39623.1 Peptidylprolyl isomerase [Altererythrobacter insulae]TMM45950.1 FKBP-type peptidyl-prolyl cis-trans isomerase [Colwellia ponticola]
MTDSTQAKIQHDSSILVHITMKLSDGSAADSTKVNNKPAKIIMGDNSISPAFEAELIGMSKGDTREFTLVAKDAFGESNPDNIHYMDIDKFTAEVPAKIGNIITFTQPGGELPGMIKEINGTSVTIDFNHPLAGQTVTFVIDLVDIL